MSRSEFFSLRNLQGCCLLFNYQGSLFCCLIRDSHINIPYVFSLVNNFFNLFFVVLSLRITAQPTAYLDYHTCRQMSTSILIFFAYASFPAISQMSLASALLG